MITRPNFPKNGQFQTKAEVDEYFSYDQIQCLMCGKWFVELTYPHLYWKHHMTLDDYRERFGLPWLHGLVGQLAYERRSKASKQRYLDGKTGLNNEFAIQKALLASPRPKQPYDMRQRQERVLAVYGHTSQWQYSDYEKIVQRMEEQGRNITDVCRDDDVPSFPVWSRYVKTHPELATKAKQVRKKLRARRKEQDLNAYGHDAVWHYGDYERIVQRMEEQKRTLPDVCQDHDLPSLAKWYRYVKTHPELTVKMKRCAT